MKSYRKLSSRTCLCLMLGLVIGVPGFENVAFAQEKDPVQKKGLTRFFKLPGKLLRHKKANEPEGGIPLSGDQMGQPIISGQDGSIEQPRPEKTSSSSARSDSSKNNLSDNATALPKEGLSSEKDVPVTMPKNGFPPIVNSEFNEPVSTNLSPSLPTSKGNSTVGFSINGGIADTPVLSSTAVTISNERKSKAQVNDFAPPNPEVEKNPTALDAYSAAVKLGQMDRYDDAVVALNDYVVKYPDSRLAPRAYYLIALYANEAIKRQAAVSRLLNDYSTSRYVTALKDRAPELLGDRPTTGTTVAVPTPSVNVPPVTPVPVKSELKRLEDEMTQKPTHANKLAYAEQCVKEKNYQLAEPLLEGLVAGVTGTEGEPKCLDLLSQCQIELGQLDEARLNIDNILRQWPKYDRLVRVQLSQAIVAEKVGNLKKAEELYRAIDKDAPGSDEAQIARRLLMGLNKQ